MCVFAHTHTRERPLQLTSQWHYLDRMHVTEHINKAFCDYIDKLMLTTLDKIKHFLPTYSYNGCFCDACFMVACFDAFFFLRNSLQFSHKTDSE